MAVLPVGPLVSVTAVVPLASTLALVPLAFVLGAFTFVSPCAYPLLPGYVSYYLGGDTAADGGTTAQVGPADAVVAAAPGLDEDTAGRLARAVVVGVVVSLGFFLVYGVIAGVVVAVGSRVLANAAVLELVVGAALVVLGGTMAAGRDLPTPQVRLPERRRSLAGYFTFGVVYAVAAAGCSAPLFVGVTLRAVATGVVAGVATLVAYAAGMGTLMVAVTVAASLGRDLLLRRLSARAGSLRRVAGVLLMGAGVVEVYLFLFRFDGLELLGLA